MLEYYSPHRGAQATAGLAGGGVLLWLGVAGQQSQSWAQGPSQILLILGAVFFLAGALQALFYLVERALDVEEHRRQVQSISAEARLLEAAARLTPDQAKLVPGLDFKATEVDLLDGRGEILLYLVTPEGRIPLTWLRDYLNNCGVTFLYPVRNYAEGSAAYSWARAFTAWAIARGYALPAEGNRSAQWTSEQTKSQLQNRFGLEPGNLREAQE